MAHPTPPAPDVQAAIRGLTRGLAHELSPGDVAALRRLAPNDPSTPVFWRAAALYLRPAGFLNGSGAKLDEAERTWATVMAAAAVLGPLHRESARLGRALADAGFSELRFVRLLRASGEQLRDATLLAARYLSAKGQSADVTGLARLLLSDGRGRAEDVRRTIARDYYANESQKNGKE